MNVLWVPMKLVVYVLNVTSNVRADVLASALAIAMLALMSKQMVFVWNGVLMSSMRAAVLMNAQLTRSFKTTISAPLVMLSARMVVRDQGLHIAMLVCMLLMLGRALRNVQG